MRWTPKTSLLGLVILISAVASANLAEARSRYRNEDGTHSRRSYSSTRSYNRTRDDAEHVRAQESDPTGSYRAYPDWARYALSPKR